MSQGGIITAYKCLEIEIINKISHFPVNRTPSLTLRYVLNIKYTWSCWWTVNDAQEVHQVISDRWSRIYVVLSLFTHRNTETDH